MRLDHARLCLDCEEIHEESECPACGSEAFAFLTRWIKISGEPPPARRDGPPPIPAHDRTPAPPRPAPNAGQVEAWRRIIEGPEEPRRNRLLGSLLGLTAMGVAGWAWTRKKGDEPSTDDE